MRTHEHVYAISTDNIRTAIVQAEDVLSDLLEKVLSTSENESDLQFAVEMLGVIARHQEQLACYADAASPTTEDLDGEDAPEIVE